MISNELNNLLNEMGRTMARVDTNTANLASAIDRIESELDQLSQSQSSVNSRLTILETYDLKTTKSYFQSELDAIKIRLATLEAQQSNWSKWVGWALTIAQMTIISFIAYKLGFNQNP